MTNPPRPTGRAGLGWTGEGLAARHLERAGYTILGRRWRCARGDLDLIADDDGTLVFVEVRTRRGDQRGSAIESITPTKAARLVNLAGLYLAEHADLAMRDWRIDVVGVQMDAAGRVQQIDHIVSAVEG